LRARQATSESWHGANLREYRKGKKKMMNEKDKKHEEFEEEMWRDKIRQDDK
jgi:hypothetical protein